MILLLATGACDREKPEYGEETLSPAPVVGVVSFETMQVALSSATENYSAVVRPAAAAAAATADIAADGTDASGTRAETGALEGYRFNLIDKQGAAVAEFPYGAYPRFEVPAGVYTLTVQPADPQALAWETQSYRAEQEVYVRKDATTAVGEVLCTPATVGVAMTFDPAFGETAAATVVCNGEEALFTPAESRTAYFLPSEEASRSKVRALHLPSSSGKATTSRNAMRRQPNCRPESTLRQRPVSAISRWRSSPRCLRRKYSRGSDSRRRST